MKDVFATLYETVFGIFDINFNLIFSSLFDEGGYVMFGLTFILVPLIMWLLFYFVWKNPYGKFWHWFFWLMITVLIVSGTTWGIASTEIFTSDTPSLIGALADVQTGYEQFAKTLPLKYAIYNGLLTIMVGFIYSVTLKRWSNIQIHLPF